MPKLNNLSLCHPEQSEGTVCIYFFAKAQNIRITEQNDSIINILAHSLFGMDNINQPDTAI